MEQKIISSRHISDLNKLIAIMISEGWEPIGGHTAITTSSHIRYAGAEPKETVYEYEYAQTMRKK